MAKEPTNINRNAKQKQANEWLAHWRENMRAPLDLHWSALDPPLLMRAIDTVTRAGAAIILGRTRDGGALSVVVLMDDHKMKEYPASVEAAEHLLTGLAEHFD